MKTHRRALAAVLALIAAGCAPQGTGGRAARSEPTLTPIRHATMVIRAAGTTIYVDPVGDPAAFKKFPGPDIILITDIHGDHLAPKLVGALKAKKTAVVGPRAVVDKLGYGEALRNGERGVFHGVNIEAVPAYNLTKERLRFHPKGRGNGYVVTAAGRRIYVSGDTEDVREMRALRNIDYAFVCMNLPYTMTVEQAASAVLEMKPRVVVPYHYRGRQGEKQVFSDLAKFTSLVGKDKSIEVRLLKWYE
jgi:L-ascorbate metabolism protein UlaG (beta-lactamase superfamily)